MDISPPLLSYMTQNYWSCPSSDSEFYNISSPEAVSPISYMDFSPSAQPQNGSSPPHSQRPGGGKAPASLREEGGRSRVGTRRMRSKNPSKQRQSASEKEKLRMRDLTKALHHLRTYLPPTVAPVGQTLTKIETLRLTIRYISYLSAQLGLSEESLYQRKDMRTSRDQESPQNQTEGFCCYNSPPAYWGFRDELTTHQELHQSTFRPEHVSRKTEINLNQVCMNVETPAYDDSLNSSLESLLEYPSYANTALTYQNYGKAVHCPSIAPEFWG
ncbi:mesoderm posterior bb [Triplophysa rosa]|uniref:mesoderm posterior bb n=1 Tax=Triplophysa rosa TaxID=992332 RepID=UPI0025461049|nr:mesoderm posterior bb [Triplophysa rosa]